LGWWGKLIGGAFGFMLGGPLGALLGAALGHNLDRGLGRLAGQESLEPGDRERIQTAFFTATFSVMGHLAKVDGRVSEQEIAVAQSLMSRMDLSPVLRRTAIRLFNEGKAQGFPLDEVVQQLRRECHRRQDLIRMFLEIQIQAALADGRLSPGEEQLLLRICRYLGVSEASFRLLEGMVRAALGMGSGEGEKAWAGRPGKKSLADAYAILNLPPEADEAEVKRAYRRLRSQHHPDKLVSKGLPEEMMKLAAQKSHEIRTAYETIKSHRGF
jgi:DnaJ like chaperone protein